MTDFTGHCLSVGQNVVVIINGGTVNQSMHTGVVSKIYSKDGQEFISLETGGEYNSQSVMGLSKPIVFRRCCFDTMAWLDYSDDPSMWAEYKEEREDNGFEPEEEDMEAWDSEKVPVTGQKFYQEFLEWCIEYANRDRDDWFDNIKYSDINDMHWVITGADGLWNGKHTLRPHIFSSLIDAMHWCMEGVDDAEVYKEGNKIEFIGKHHDGQNCYTLFAISDEAYENISVDDMISEHIIYYESEEKAKEIEKNIVELPDYLY